MAERTAGEPAATVDREAIAEIRAQIAPYIRRTPVVRVDAEEFGAGAANLTLKLELAQRAGSFKARGAFANLLRGDVPEAGVVAASGGNHGAAVAYAARTLGIPAKIFVPETSSPAKVARIRDYGADLVQVGDRYGDALAAAERWQGESGALAVHAFDDVLTILGQATIGAEIEEQAPELDTILVAVGGGGLIAGIATWFTDSLRIVAVEPEACPTLERALAAGTPVDAPTGGIAADSLGATRIGTLNFPIVQRHVDRVVLVGEEDILEAQRTLWSACRIVAEPGGATALSALVSGVYEPAAGERILVVLSGGNTVAVDFDRQQPPSERPR